MPTYVVTGTVEYDYTHIVDAEDDEHLQEIIEDLAYNKNLKLDEPLFVAVDIKETIEDDDRVNMWRNQGDGYA